MSTLSEMLEYGPIVASDAELGLYITVNGSYYNLWVGDGSTFENTDCTPVGRGFDGLHGADCAEVIERAERWLNDLINGGEE
jgi:hypothetical protein